jgi:hypothetical protein
MDEEIQTAYEYKELVVEFGARTWSPASMSQTISPNNLIAMSMLDSNNLKEGAPLYSGPDIYTSLRHEVSSATREQWLIETIRRGLRHNLRLRGEVNRLLDEDLRAAGEFSLIGQSNKTSPKVVSGLRFRLQSC